MNGVLLLSDGIDSPVAGYLMGKQGVNLIALHFVTSGDANEQANNVAKIVRQLERSIDAEVNGFIASHNEALTTFSSECRRNLTCVLCKRMMLRIAGRLAVDSGSAFVITGDSLGQVASQTLTNLFVEEQATSVPILRPLIGMDKVEITRISKEIGVYEASISSNTRCEFTPWRPSTNSSLEEVLQQEGKIDIESIVANEMDGMRGI
ncbi:MAG: tRNA 4-thiouridine(8) synthase ThiI [Methanobacteriota archaeon]|nr:MAG: tRNA 4-thiouridine(8) synthase ThiI [Euryarchaeota archaeon]